MLHRFLLLLLLLASLPIQGSAQEANSWIYGAANDYQVIPNVVYSSANNFECKLDAYVRNNPSHTTPTLVYFHGGGWVIGSKDTYLLNFLPYFEMGLSVVNVDYRLARVSLAPAAVQDARLALRWVFKNAKQYGFDTTKIIVSGRSAGSHLALMTGMLDPSHGFDVPTDWDYTGVEPKVAAVINWFGIADVKDLLSGQNRQEYAVNWFGTLSDKESLAQKLSPLTYIRKGLPPIFTVHGDKDQLVPYAQAVRLHDGLTKAGVPNHLMTIPGGKHGEFTKEEMTKAFAAIKEFLKKNGIIESSAH